MPLFHPMNRSRSLKTGCALLLYWLVSGLSAQTLWPSAQQWQQLRQRAQTDPVVQQVIDGQRRLANEALEATPHPLETISSAGRLQGDPVKSNTEASLKDMERIAALAIVFTVSGETCYASRAAVMLQAWANTNHPSGQPIDETTLEPAIFGYRLIRDQTDPVRRQAIDAWLRNLANAEIDSRDLSKKTATNNWHSHRLKTVGLIGYALADRNLIDWARNGLRQQIGDNLRADGSSIDFLERDALSYHVYDLRPLFTLALALAEDGDDFYHWRAANGASLEHSIKWMRPWLTGEKQHAEFITTQVAFDKARANNHESGHEIGGLWDAKNAVPLLNLAAAWDGEYATLARRLGGDKIHWRLLLSTQPP